MRLLLTARNVEITPALRQLVNRKLEKLDRMLQDSALSAQVVLTREKHRCVSEISVHARGDHMLHGLGDAPQWQGSLGLAIEKIAQQAQKLKGKWDTRKRRAASPKVIQTGALPGEGPRRPRIVRTSFDAVKPMTLEDAALRIDAGRSGFLVFRNATTDAVNILYRRDDGRLGLIEPEV